MGRLLLLLMLLLSFAGVTLVLLDLRSDGPLAFTFCLGVPALLLGAAVVLGMVLDGAVLLGPRGKPIPLGRCRKCGTTFHIGEGNCLTCGEPTGFWEKPDRIRTRGSTKPRASNEGMPPLGMPQTAGSAAEFLVQQAGIHEVERLDAIEACLNDPAVAQHLFNQATKILNPRNEAEVHRPEWHALRAAVELLNRHHRM